MKTKEKGNERGRRCKRNAVSCVRAASKKYDGESGLGLLQLLSNIFRESSHREAAGRSERPQIAGGRRGLGKRYLAGASVMYT